MRNLSTLLVTILLLAACQTAPTKTYDDHDQLIAGLIKIATKVCVTEAKKDSETKELFTSLDLSPEVVCECAYQRFFGVMDERELDRFLDDSAKYGNKVAEREPWKRRVASVTIACMSQMTADLTPSPR